ncbi:hypothetical protein D1872_278580 [compost metagenome]
MVKTKKIGVKNTKISDPSETYLVNTIDRIAMIPAYRAGKKIRVAMTPIVVAIPFPPRKRK